MVDPFNDEEILTEESQVHFSLKQFTKMLIFHLFMYIVLGPLITIPLIFFLEKRSTILLRNIGFWSFSQELKSQMLHCILMAIAIILMWFFNHFSYLNPVELFMGLLAVSIKAFIVAFRYATTSDNKWMEYHTKIMKQEERN